MPDCISPTAVDDDDNPEGTSDYIFPNDVSIAHLAQPSTSSAAAGAVVAALVGTSSAPGGVTLINPFRSTRHEPQDLVALATEIQKADSFASTILCSKLQAIAEQARSLQAQARKVLAEAQVNTHLNNMPCNFVKQPGHVYYVYSRPFDQKYMSMISPQEWGADCPHEFLGAFRYEFDQSWSSVRRPQRSTADTALIDGILAGTRTAGPVDIRIFLKQGDQED